MTKRYNVKDLEMLQDDVGAWYYKLNGRPFTGYAFAVSPQTNLLTYEGYLKEGYQNGVQKYFYQNGQLKTEYEMKDNIYHGCAKSWYESGVLRYEAEYDTGKEIWSKSYNEKGDLT